MHETWWYYLLGRHLACFLNLLSFFFFWRHENKISTSSGRILWISEAGEEIWKIWVIPLFPFSLDIGRCIMFVLIVWSGKDLEDIFCVYYCWLKSWLLFLDVAWHISYSFGIDFGGLMFPQRGSDVAESFMLWLCFQLLGAVSSIASCSENWWYLGL